MQITMPDGSTREVMLKHFPALDGWNIQRDFVRFAYSDDVEVRTEFTMRVLSYCEIDNKGVKVELKTKALVDNHLGTWQNVRDVFEAVLKLNGIDSKTHAEQPMYWEKVGASIAIAFLGQMQELLGPAMKMVAETAVSE